MLTCTIIIHSINPFINWTFYLMNQKSTKMKKVLILLLSVFVISFTSCSDDDNPPTNGGGGNVAKEVLNQFEKDFPSATDVVWTVNKDNYAIAEYNLPPKTRTKASNVLRKYKTWYKNQKDLAHIKYMDEEDIDYADLPEKVKETFEASEYGNKDLWERDDVEMIKRYQMSTIYSIEVESKSNDSEADLYFDETGILIKVIFDADDDDIDKNQGWIVDKELPESIKNHLKENYESYKIVDIEVEDDDLDEIEGNKKVKHWEIEIITDNTKKEIIFNYESSDWMYTKWEVEGENLPKAILNTINEKYKEYELDDEDEYDMIDHNEKGLLYKVELESEDDDKKDDLLVYFNDKGEVVFEIKD